MSALTFKTVQHGSADYMDTLVLRDEILRKPLGLVFSPEQLGEEAGDIHLACYHQGTLTACLVLTPEDDTEGKRTIRMRQVAVIQDQQKGGVGTALVHYAEELSQSLGYELLTAHAREVVLPFYEKLGYRIVGKRFVEVTIPHRKVEKEL